MAMRVQRAVAMSTPPRQIKQRSNFSEQEKTSLLENFDLEVEDKTRAFKSSLSAHLASFLHRQETEILKIPRDLRSMTLGDLESKWGGSWAGTIQRIAKEKIEEREKEEAAQRQAKRLEEEAQGKRKRAEEGLLESSPNRSNKNARKENIPGSARKIPSSASKRRLANKTPKSKPYPKSSGPSGLPQDHVFNPLLPATPGIARRARRNESFFSANGSPIVMAPSPESSLMKENQSPSAEHEDSDGDDLPDPEVLEAKLLAQAYPQFTASSSTPPKSKPSSRKPKRAPSLIFRQSIAPNAIATSSRSAEKEEVDELASIPLSDGRTVTFNPLDLSPGRIDAEMEEGGLGENEKLRIKGKVKDAVFQALQAKMEKWKVLG